MKFLSICSGIEAASVAWNPLGWKAVAFSEIEPFPCAVLEHHYPDTPNLGDMTKFNDWKINDSINLVCGGTPCQSFSVAGLRKGMADPRGNLALVFLGIVDRFRPRWVVWENVPGVLSSNGTEDFGAFLGALGELEYGSAYRVFDAQYFGLAQRRKRVFVVGHLGDWRPSAAVLFERESLSGNPPPRREARQDVAPTISARTKGGGGLGTDFDCDGGLIMSHDPACTLTARDYKGPLQEADLSTVIAHSLRAQSQSAHDPSLETYVTHALTGNGHDASEDGTGRGTPIVPIDLRNALRGEKALDAGGGIGRPGDPAFSVTRNPQAVAFNPTAGTLEANQIPAVVFDTTQVTSKANRSNPQPGDPCHPLASGAHAPAIAIQAGALRENPDSGPDGVGVQEGAAYTLEARAEVQAVSTTYAVRRLTPRECERLQGFPDDYTLIPYRGKPAKDGPRYKALGNSWAVPCVRWIGERIELVESVLAEVRAERRAE